jgi:hypothetical protein
VPKKQNNNKSDEEYKHIGKMLVAMFEHGYVSKKTLIKMSFIKGVATGMGTVLGATVGLAILLWLLQLLGVLPVIGEVFEAIQDTIESAGDRP